MNDSYLLRPAWAEIQLDNLAHNITEVRRLIPKETKIMAIVKADAYGHGAVMASKTFLENGAEYLGVATLVEAIELRKNGLSAPILILGYTPQYTYKYLFDYNIIPTIYDIQQIKALNRIAVERDELLKIHLKVETGMERIGFNHSKANSLKMRDYNMLEVEGVFTHFATSDSADKTYTMTQFRLFNEFVNIFEALNYRVQIKHVSNSAAIIDLPELSLDMVRPGIMLYGFYPSKEVKKSKVKLKPAMKLVTELSHKKYVEAGRGIGYGVSYTTKRKTLVGTIPLGYADGYNRSLSNTGCVALRGKKAPIIGRICMDQCMIDLTGVDEAMVGDRVIVFGDGSEGEPDVDDVSELRGTIAHEVICNVSRRVPRVYLKGGKVIDTHYYF